MGSGGGPLSGGCGGKGGTASPAERHPPARRGPAPSLCPVKSGTADLRRRGRGVQLLAARVRPSPYPQPGSRGRPASGRRRPLPTWTGLRRTPSAEHALSSLSPRRPRTAGPPRSPQPLSFSVARTALLGAGGHRDSSVTEQPPVGGGVPGLSPRLPHVPGRKGTSPRRHSQEKPDVFSGEGTCSLLKPVTCVSCQTEAKALGVRGGDFGTQQGGGLRAPPSAGLRGPAAALSSLDDSVPSSRQERGEGTESPHRRALAQPGASVPVTGRVSQESFEVDAEGTQSLGLLETRRCPATGLGLRAAGLPAVFTLARLAPCAPSPPPTLRGQTGKAPLRTEQGPRTEAPPGSAPRTLFQSTRGGLCTQTLECQFQHFPRNLTPASPLGLTNRPLRSARPSSRQVKDEDSLKVTCRHPFLCEGGRPLPPQSAS